MERGWVYGSLMFGESQVRTGYLVIGILKTPSLRHALTGLSAEFAKLKVEALTERFDEYVGALAGERPVGQRRLQRRRRPGRGQRRPGAERDGQAGGAQALYRGPHRAGP